MTNSDSADRMANEGIDVLICSRRVVSSCAHETAGRTSSASGPVRTPLVAQPGSLVSPFYPFLSIRKYSEFKSWLGKLCGNVPEIQVRTHLMFLALVLYCTNDVNLRLPSKSSLPRNSRSPYTSNRMI
jgi:hypothetical protein